MSGYINLINNILDYDKQKVVVLLDIDDILWFSFREVLTILGYKDLKKAIKRLQLVDNYKASFAELDLSYSVSTIVKVHPHTVFVSEHGLNQILTESKRPQALPFKKELYENILPTIRKTGEYKIKSTDNKRHKEMNIKLQARIKEMEELLKKKDEEILELKDTADYLETKNEVKPILNSLVYIRKFKIGKKICYKIGYSDNRKSRKVVRKTTSSEMNLYEIEVDLDGKQVEQCVRNINRLHLIKQKADVMCYLDLETVIETLNNCMQMLGKHVGTCTHCNQKMKLNKFKSHYDSL